MSGKILDSLNTWSYEASNHTRPVLDRRLFYYLEIQCRDELLGIFNCVSSLQAAITNAAYSEQVLKI